MQNNHTPKEIPPFYPDIKQVYFVIFNYWMSRLSDTQFKVLLAITHLTIGRRKKSDRISNSQLCTLTGFTKNPVRKACNHLVKLNLITCSYNQDEFGAQDANSYELYDLWKAWIMSKETGNAD